MAKPEVASLPARQREVAEALLRGEAPSAIAKAMGMKSANGIYQHKRRLEEKGFRFPKRKSGRPRGSSHKVPAQQSKRVTVSNGHLVELLGEVRETITGKSKMVEEALTGNTEERKRIEEEVEERKSRLEVLGSERQQLQTTQEALKGAVETVPA